MARNPKNPYGLPAAKNTPGNNDKMDRCVVDVMAKGNSKESAIRICKANIAGEEDGRYDQPMKRVVPKDLRPEGLEMASFLLDARVLTETGKDGRGWIQAFPMGDWLHPIYGDIVMDEKTATQMKENFDNGVRGQDVPLDYSHGEDVAKGNRAAGWVHAMEVRTAQDATGEDGLWWDVQLTKTALGEVRDGEWRYFSPEYARKWQDPVSRNEYNNVVIAGALTNTPFLKGIMPLNLQEIIIAGSEISDKEHAEPGTQGGEGGSPTPLSQDPNAKQDPEAPPAPQIPPNSSENVLPFNEGDDMDRKKLCELLGLSEDATDEAISAAIAKLTEDAAVVRELENDTEEARSFSEKFPKEHERMQRLEAKARKADAREFAESFRFSGGKTFPAVVIEKLEEIHISMSEGKFGPADLKAVLDEILDKGIVKMSDESGSTGADGDPDSGGGDMTAEDFRAKIHEMMEADKVDMKTAYKLIAKEHPEGHEAYRQSVQRNQPIEQT